MDVYTKRPGEDYNIAKEFSATLPAGLTLVSGTLVAVDRGTGLDATSTILASANATISGTQAIFHGRAGTSPNDYFITLTVTLSDGSKLIEEILVQVRLAMLLIATPGASDANSYCTLSEADEYHKTHLYNTVWLKTDDWKRQAALIWASRLLDEQVEWKGWIASFTQRLFWPRGGVFKEVGGGYYRYAPLFPPNVIPDWLKDATAELARHLLTEDRTKERGYGIGSVKADTVDVVFDKYDVKPFLPPSVRSIVQFYGIVAGPGSQTTKLVRV